MQSFARDGCGLPAQSADSTGCHVERRGLGPEVETSRLVGAFTFAKHNSKAPNQTAETLGKTEMTTFLQKKVILLLQSEKFVLFLNR
ncbi:hypothetical protein, partial [uncultured Alistipes sp.]|uniref:hypothetical protein n=1 Tax=uncultured Alistipes sp. TaxID=538949 RepID=UPI002613D594